MAYEAFLDEWGGGEYQRVRWSWGIGGTLESFFGLSGWSEHSVPNEQTLDLPGLEGRLLSSSYLPGPEYPRREDMLAAARALFEAHERGGTITMSYQTRVYVGRL